MKRNANYHKIAGFQASFLPIITIIVSMLTVVINYFLYIKQGHFSINSLPSFSQTATFYPMSKIFAAGISLFSFLFFLNGQLFCDYININNFSKSNFLHLPPIISLLFTLTGCINKSEHPNIHGCFSCSSFFSLLIYAIFTYRTLNQNKVLQHKTIRFSIIVIGILSTIIIIFTAPYTNSSKIHVVHAVVEYFMVFGLFVFFGLWYFDFKHIHINLYIEEIDKIKES